jgi:hypothetical protein
MNQTSNFFSRSLSVATAFLQTAVVIDDRAFRDERNPPEALPGPLLAPDTLATAETSAETLPQISAKADDSISEKADPNPHGIDARAVIDSFAQFGIVCSVLRRAEDEDLTLVDDRAHRLSAAADISVVDWQVHNADGSDSSEQTLNFLQAAVRESIESQPQQLRLIIIYTGSLDLIGVGAEVAKCLESAAGVAPFQESELAFRIRGIRVVVLGKPSNKRPIQVHSHEVESDAQLAKRAAQEFAIMTAGLVSNVALASLTEIRRATHRLLTRFESKLDAPFLSHRALLNPPNEGNEQLIPLIVAELEAILEEQVSQDLLSDDAITDWLSTRPDPLPLIDAAPNIKTTETARQAVRDLCLKGVKQYKDFAVPSEPSWVKKLANDKANTSQLGKLTNLIAGELADGSNEALELLMSLRPRYNKQPPMLSLGTLLSSFEFKERTTAYWLCLQPACDCYIRKDGPRRLFPLLRLRATDDRFNLIVEGPIEVIRLRWEPRPYQLQMFEFESNSPSKAVHSIAYKEAFWFLPPDRARRFRWLGQLKFPQAQRVAQDIASEAARVGLTESEWLRRIAK